jgi:glucokinase
MSAHGIDLVADIGATNSRFALVGADGGIAQVRVFGTADYRNIADAIKAYALQVAPSKTLRNAILAVACPVLGDKISLVNHPWAFSTAELRQELGLGQLRVINDFTAVALAIPKLNPPDVVQIGSGSPVAGHPIGVIGPGTGLGISGLIPAGGDWIPLQSEGGHVTLAPATARETEVLNLVRSRFDHVSTERLVSGPGLITLYRALSELDGVPAAPFSSAEIADPKVGENDTRAVEALEMFCAMLGTAAGNLALTLGAQGGIYIAGGIVPGLGASFHRSTFRRSFEGKGRFHDYLSTIPTYVITRPLPALLGAAHQLRSGGFHKARI